jgi:hypothetical protein
VSEPEPVSEQLPEPVPEQLPGPEPEQLPEPRRVALAVSFRGLLRVCTLRPGLIGPKLGLGCIPSCELQKLWPGLQTLLPGTVHPPPL